MTEDEGPGALIPPRLETKRLILRSMSMDDLDFILDHFGRDEVNQYSSYENIKDRAEAADIYKKFMEPGKSTGFRLGIALRDTGELIGTIGFHAYRKRDFRAEVGYDLAQEHWGKGLMREAASALIKHGFEEMALNRIEATVDPANSRSVNLLENMGFRREGLLRERYYYKGGYHDEYVYSVLKRECCERQEG